jgi:hypothetical protein
MARSESCTELWLEAERQLSRDLRIALMDVKDALYGDPEVGAIVEGADEHTREYDNGTLKVTYACVSHGDTQEFVFKSLGQSEQRLFVLPRDVFVSYSHQDQTAFDRILAILDKVERGGDAVFWTDKRIKPGQRWLDVIRDHLTNATGALLLVSPSFLERPFIRKEELPVLLDKADESYEEHRERPHGHRFLLSWIPVRRVDPDTLDNRDHWNRIRQYQAIGGQGNVLEGADETGRAVARRMKVIERQLMEFLQEAFETGS